MSKCTYIDFDTEELKTPLLAISTTSGISEAPLTPLVVGGSPISISLAIYIDLFHFVKILRREEDTVGEGWGFKI